MEPEWAMEHFVDFQRKGKSAYKSRNLGHGNTCSECNNAILADMIKPRPEHFDDGLSD